MSSVRTVLIIIIGILILGVVGYGSFVASRQFIDEPEVTQTSSGATAEFDKDGNPTSIALKNYQPKQVNVSKNQDGDLVIKWDTAKSVTTLFYVTPDPEEKISDVLVDWSQDQENEEKVYIPTGNFRETSSSEKPSTAHTVTLSERYWQDFLKSTENEDKKLYYYIVVNVNEHRLPYGNPDKTDSTTGPNQGYPIDLTTY